MLKRGWMGWPIATATAALLVACSGTSTKEAPTTSASPSGVEAIARTLDTSPEGCGGPAPSDREVARYFGRLSGGSPVWGGFGARFNASTNAFHTTQAPRKPDGWSIKVLWVIEPGVSAPVTLSGHNVTTGAPLRFTIGGVGHGAASESPVLDPTQPAIPIQDGRWKEFPSYLYFPSAGCYVLTASWAGGSWQMGFGFGR